MARIICDAYFVDKRLWGDDPNTEFNKRISAVNNMYGWLCEQGILEKVSFEYKHHNNGVCFAFDAKDLAPYRQDMEMSGIEGAGLAVRHIFDESYTPCIYSGAIELGWAMSTYRDVDGCVGRSWECSLIQGLNTRAIYDVSQAMEEGGIRAGISKLFSFYKWNEVEKEKHTELDAKIKSAEQKTEASASHEVTERDTSR